MKSIAAALTIVVCFSSASVAFDTRQRNYGNDGRAWGNEQYNVRPNFGGAPQGSIANPYRLRAPNGRGLQVYSDGPIEPGSPMNPFRIRPE